MIIIIYRIHKVLYSLLRYKMENNHWLSLDESPLHELFFTHSVGKSFLHLGFIFWWPALPSFSYHLIKRSWINGQDDNLPFKGDRLAIQNPSIPGQLLLDQSLHYLLSLKTAVLSYANNIGVSGPCGDLSKKAINSDWFSHVTLVYLYIWMPGNSWRNRHPASWSLGC